MHHAVSLGHPSTFEVDADDVVVPHKVATGQHFRQFRGVGPHHIPHPIADYTVWVQPQTGQWVHPEHVLLEGKWPNRILRSRHILSNISVFIHMFPQQRNSLSIIQMKNHISWAFSDTINGVLHIWFLVWRVQSVTDHMVSRGKEVLPWIIVWLLHLAHPTWSFRSRRWNQWGTPGFAYPECTIGN